MNIHRDFKEFLESFNRANVEYVVIGAHALAFHGMPRFTGHMDLFVRVTSENAQRIEQALNEFGFAGLHTASDFQKPGFYVQLGVAPVRIDVSTGISGVAFDEVWEQRVAGELGGVPVAFISRDDFIRNKRASGRPKDLLDIELLG